MSAFSLIFFSLSLPPHYFRLFFRISSVFFFKFLKIVIFLTVFSLSGLFVQTVLLLLLISFYASSGLPPIFLETH